MSKDTGRPNDPVLDHARVLATAKVILENRGELFVAECLDMAIRKMVGVRGKPYPVKEEVER